MIDNSSRKFPSNAAIVFLVILISILYHALGGILTLYFPINEYSNLYPVFQGISQILFLLIPTILVAKLVPLKASEIFRLDGEFEVKHLVIGLLGLLLLKGFTIGYVSLQEALIPESLMGYYKDYMDIVEDMYIRLLSGKDLYDFILSLTIGALIPSFSEELLYRGFTQRSLEERNSPRFAIIVGSIIFGVVHFNLIHFVPLTVFGIFLGYLAYYTKNIFLPIILHFGNNAMAVLMIYLGEMEHAVDTVEVGIVNALMLFLGGSAGLIILIKYLIRSESYKT